MTCENVGERKEEKVKSKYWTGLPEKESSKKRYIAFVVASFIRHCRNSNRGHMARATLSHLFCFLLVGVLN